VSADSDDKNLALSYSVLMENRLHHHLLTGSHEPLGHHEESLPTGRVSHRTTRRGS
jgi:hypothetical protein